MAIFHLPPPPFIGGRQPYDPGRKVTPPPIAVAPDNPPPQHPAKDIDKYIRTYDPELWKRSASTGQTDSPGEPEPPPNPIFGHPARVGQDWMARVRWAWEQDAWPQQRQIEILPQPVVAAAFQPTPPQWLENVLQSWQTQQWPQQRQIELLPQPVVVADDRPKPLPWLDNVLQSWQQQQWPTQRGLGVLPATPEAGPDDPPWQHPARDVEKYIRTFDPELWKRSASTGQTDSPGEPPEIPDNPPGYLNWAQRYANVWEAQEIVYTIQLPTYSEILPEIIDDPPIGGVDSSAIIRQSWEPTPWPQQRFAKVFPPAVIGPPPKAPAWLNTVLRAWDPPFQYPQTLVKIVQPFHADAPPSTSRVIINILVQSWNVPWWGPPQPTKLVQPFVAPIVDNPPPYNTQWQQEIAELWQPGPPQLIQRARVGPITPAVIDDPPRYSTAFLQQMAILWQPGPPQPWQGYRFAPIPPPVIDNPPRYSTEWLQQIAMLWQPGPPQPTQGERYFSIPDAIVDNPPFPGISSLNTILQAWQPGPPDPVQKPPIQIISGIEPPPIPPEPPEPPRGGRAYYGGTSSVFENPKARQARRMALERLQRIELGILPKDISAEQKVEAKVIEFYRVPPLVQVDQDALVEKILREVREEVEMERQRLVEEEEAEVQEVIAILLKMH